MSPLGSNHSQRMAGSFTRQVYDQVHNDLEERLALVGLRKLKNVTLPNRNIQGGHALGEGAAQTELSTERLIIQSPLST